MSTLILYWIDLGDFVSIIFEFYWFTLILPTIVLFVEVVD